MTAMPPLQLDHQRRRRALPRRGTVLLIVALAACIANGAYYAVLNKQADNWEAKADQAARASTRNTSRTPGSDRAAADLLAEVGRAKVAVREINRSWERLFKAVEAVGGTDVTLLALEPNPEKRSVRLGGEARNMSALLDYIRRLQEHDVFGAIYLQNHQVQQQEAQKPVRFILLADWREKS
jgi:hypothetical protein